MSSKDIIKQILIKFKGDNTDLKKSVADAQKVVSNLNRGTSLNQQYGAMDKFIKNISKTNENLSKTFTVFQKGMKGVLEGDMQKFEKRAEAQYKRIQILQRELDKASQSGDRARAGRIQGIMGSANQRLSGAMSGYNQTAQALGTEAQGSAGGFMKGMAGAMGIPMLATPAAVGVIAAKALSLMGNSPAQAISNNRALADVSRGYFKSGMGGDLSTAYTMITDPTAAKRARHAAGTEGKLFDLETYTNNPLKTIENSIRTILTTSPLNYTSEMKKRAAQGALENFENIKNSNMNPEKLNYLTGVNSSRLAFQRQFGLNDSQRFNIANEGRDQLMSESETQGVSGALRDALGSRAGSLSASQAGLIRKKFGTDLGLSTSMLGSLGTISGGEIPNENKTIEIMGKAFKHGIEDSALAEKVTQYSIQAIEKTGMMGDPTANIKRISELAVAISPNGQTNSRTVAGALGLSASQAQGMQAGGTSQLVAMQVFKKLAAQTDNPALALPILLKEYSQDPEKLRNIGNDPALMALVKNKDKFVKSANNSVTDILSGNLQMYGVNASSIFDSYIKQGKTPEQARLLTSNYIRARGPVSNLNPESLSAYSTSLIGQDKYNALNPNNIKDYLPEVIAKNKRINESVTGEIGKSAITQEVVLDSSTINMDAKVMGETVAAAAAGTKAGLSSGFRNNIKNVIEALQGLSESVPEFLEKSPQSRAGQ
jgi:hypothetical protein